MCAPTWPLLQGRVIGGAHEDIVDLYAHIHLCSRFHPFGISLKCSPRCVARFSILICKDVNQYIGLRDGLPVADDRHSMFLEKSRCVFAETRMKKIDRASLSHRISTELEATRVRSDVLDRRLKIRTTCWSWRRRVL